MAAHLLVLGKGTVGAPLLGQLAAARDELRAREALDLRLAGAADTRGSWFDPAGVDPREARARLAAAAGREALPTLHDRLAALPEPVLVDCTAADGMEAVYAQALERGIHVVTANKRPLAVRRRAREALFATAHRRQRALHYETTVGASLPVVRTLQDLVRTGDRITLIEGALSGTLGYLADEVSRGAPLSAAVRAAAARGYTEPHPREDLAGIDVARKALILARELDLPLELEDVRVEPFVPAGLLAEDDREAFLASLTSVDAAFAARVRALRAEGRVLRYLALISPSGVSVGPVAVPLDHPAARLRGTEAMVAFHTTRYSELPLVVQGPGAGGEVTAAGVLADVIAIARARRLATGAPPG